MSGSTFEAMADAIDGASVVLYAISEEYKNSSNCRLEAMYAHQRGVPMVPLMLQDQYKAAGWLGMLLGTHLWYPVFGETPEKDEPFCTTAERIVAKIAACTGSSPAPSSERRSETAVEGAVASGPQAVSGAAGAAPVARAGRAHRPALGAGIGYLVPRTLVERTRAGAPRSGRTRCSPLASVMVIRRTSDELPHLEQNWRDASVCVVKQPEQRITHCLTERSSIPSTLSTLRPICISTDCIA